MKTLDYAIRGLTRISFSRKHDAPFITTKLGGTKESHAQREQRTWRLKLHTTGDGQVCIPPMAIKQALVAAAKYNPVKKSGLATWTKAIESSVQAIDYLPIKDQVASQVKSEIVSCDSNGRKGGAGKRVDRIFPVVEPGWEATGRLIVLDDKIPEEVVEQYLGEAGVFVGIGRWRAEKGGLYGRYEVVSKKWR